MAERPRHPDRHDEQPATPHGRKPAGATPWGTYAFMFVVAVVVGGIIVLHLTGVVGPGVHAR
jgi:hypothetical protein